jgi:DNA-binding MarR family transcriptional regulator
MEKYYTSKGSSFYSRHLIGKLRHLTYKARQRELTPYHISPQQAHILLLIHDLGGKTTLTELANYVGRGVNTISEQMIKMENDGLVKKTREIPKSTLLSFELTEKGLDIYNRTNESRVIDETIMSVLSHEERKQFNLMLEKLISQTEKYQ